MGCLYRIGGTATVADYPHRVAVRRMCLYPGRLFLDTVDATGPSTLQQLRASFEEVVISETIWRNVPPARAYIARRPRNVAIAIGVTRPVAGTLMRH